MSSDRKFARLRAGWVLCMLVCVLTGCGEKSVPFDRKGWDAWDGHYYSRKCMVEDLMRNRLAAGMHFREVVELLGKSYFVNEQDSVPGIRYAIAVEYRLLDIDPCKGEDLFIAFDRDSLAVGCELIQWRSGYIPQP
ncbi:hypothetical protein [Alistipes sp.]|uniref:hypothetical protein n=1 Tax=Alistipes sp. TaxID=1872444 RepID=UPI003AF1250E